MGGNRPTEVDAEHRHSGGAVTARCAWAALGCGLTLSVAYAVIMGGRADSTVFLLAAGYGTALSVVAGLRMPRARRRIWWAFAGAQVSFLVGDSLWVFYEDVLHLVPYPSAADVAYLGGYPGLALGMLWLVRGRRRGRDRAAFLDAAILTTGISVVAIVFVVGPAAMAGGTTLLSQAIAAAYPVGDLLVLALVLRMLTAGIVRNTAVWALFGSILTLLLADVYYVMSVATGTSYPDWVDLGYLLSYLLLGFAALHPSAHTLSEPAPDRPDRITIARVAWLGAALMLAPLTDQVADLMGIAHSDWVVLFGGSIAAVFVVMRMWHLVTELQRKAVQLAALARRDALTGIANRRTWDHELSRACAYAREEDAPLCVGVLDMDHFKLFNDTYGHMTGDLALKETSAAWSSLVQGRGFLARFGGEEFTVLLPNMTTDEAKVVAERMRRAVSHDQTCSIGLARWNGTESPAELLARADQALYKAKHAGRDRVAVHDGSATVVVARAALENPALASLRSVYQPIVDLRTQQVVGAEALSRFEGLDPRQVFDDASRNGTEVVLESAAVREALAGWSGRGRLALNTSLTVLVTAQMQDALPQDLSGVTIEITEADLVAYTPEVMLAIDALRARGALIAIDDFGIGFSNVHRIATIRPDVIKLDMSLIRGIDGDEMLQAVVNSCLHFARLTGSEVIAEGIETEAERECVTRLGVTLGQGYLLGMPGSMAEVVAAQAGPPA